MSLQYTNEPMLDMFIFETTQLIEQLEHLILCSEQDNYYSENDINEIFRIMHTIKGSSAMMMFNTISHLAHSVEDIFYYLREEKPKNINCSNISDFVLESIDFIKYEVEKIKRNETADGDASYLIKAMEVYLAFIKSSNQELNNQDWNNQDWNNQDWNNQELNNQGLNNQCKNQPQKKQQYYISSSKESQPQPTYPYSYKATIFFEDGCEMENIRAYTVINNLRDISNQVTYIPDDIIDNDDSVEVIRRDGFIIFLKTDYDYEQVHDFLSQTIFLKDLEVMQLEVNDECEENLNTMCSKKENPNLIKTNDPNLIKTNDPNLIKTEHLNIKIIDQENSIMKDSKHLKIQESPIKIPVFKEDQNSANSLKKEHIGSSTTQSIISVSVSKLDKLMDLVGEMVIAEAMVIQNPDLEGLELDNFQKASRQLNKITSEIQDMVMAIRMVPLQTTFQKMHRIVRDMCKRLNKEIKLDIIGEETEVDKNIIEHISDPLMHLVRNAADHGIEGPEERRNKGKQETGTVTLEAKNVGSDVLIIVRDDGKGLDKNKILKRARENNLVFKDESDMTDKEIYNLILMPGFSTKENITEFSGRGVGMDVVMKNLESVGGALSVDSVLNQGTTITLKIPLTLAIIDGMNIKVGNNNYTIPINSIIESFSPRENDILQDPDGNEMIMVRGQCYPIIRLHKIFKVNTKITSLVEGILVMVEQDNKSICIFADELNGQQQVVVKALPDYILRLRKMKELAGCTLLGDGSISLIIDVSGIMNL